MLTRPLLALLCLGFLSAAAARRASTRNRTSTPSWRRSWRAATTTGKSCSNTCSKRKRRFDLTGPGRFPLWGMRREYTWFIRDGIFVRSPVSADGVKLSEADRRKAEEQWLRRQKNREEREKRNAEREAKGLPPERENRQVVIGPTGVQSSSSDDKDTGVPITNTEDMLKQVREPQFVSSAYFLKFKFETGHYALAGREKIGDIQALKIEYYPEAGLFKDGRNQPDKKDKDEDDKIEEKMNKASMVTLWVDPKTYQILQYTFDDLDWDFFPGRSLVRIGDTRGDHADGAGLSERLAAEEHRDAVRDDARRRRRRRDLSRRLRELQRSRRHLQDQMKTRRSTDVLRTFFVRSTIVVLALVCASAADAQTSPGVVGEVRVHGNHTTPDADILAIVGDVVGKPATDQLIAEIESKLEKSGRFDGVEVRKRFRSIENPDDILLMIVVDEVPGIDPLDLTPSPMKKFWSSGMFLPILHSEDGYGFTYGARISFVDRLGPRSRITVPLTWGGERQARVQLERAFKRGRSNASPASSASAAARIRTTRSATPACRYGARIESAPARWLRLGAGGRSDDVEFGDLEGHGLETRRRRHHRHARRSGIPAQRHPRELRHRSRAVRRRASQPEKARRARLRRAVRTDGARGARPERDDRSAVADLRAEPARAAPPNLRGYDAGYKAGDNLAAASAELRIPITSPLNVGRFGVKAFVDWGTIYGVGDKLSDQAFERGIGGGAYLHLTIVSISLDVARSDSGNTRFHFGMGVTFK